VSNQGNGGLVAGVDKPGVCAGTVVPPGGTLLATRRCLELGQLCGLTGWLRRMLVLGD